MPVPFRQQLRRTLETLLIAGAGGFVFDLLRFPAGWLAGAMLFCAAASLAGRPLDIPHNLARAFYIVLCMSIGAVATPQTVIGMATWPASVLAVSVAMGAVTLGTVVYLKRFHGWDTLTAVFGGLPGGLSQVMVLAAEQKLDLRPITIVQTMRVVILAVGVPAGLALFGLAGPAPLPQGSRAIAEAPGELLVMIGLSVAVALVLLRSGFPGGLIFGPMVISATLHGGDFIHVTFPPWFTNIAMVALGAVSGSRFSGTPFRLIVSYLGAALGSFRRLHLDRCRICAECGGAPVAAHFRPRCRVGAGLDRCDDDFGARAPPRSGIRWGASSRARLHRHARVANHRPSDHSERCKKGRKCPAGPAGGRLLWGLILSAIGRRCEERNVAERCATSTQLT